MRDDVKVTITIWMVALTMIAIASAAQAQVYMPQVINGRVDGVNVKDLTVKITNTRTGAEQFYKTNGAGEFLFDAANFNDFGKTVMRYTGGDVFRVELMACAGITPECTVDVTYPNDVGPGGNIFIEFDMTDMNLPCPSQPVCETCPPVTQCPADTTPYEACDECCEECQDPNEVLVWLLGSAITGAIFVSGWLVKVKVSRTGDDAFSKEMEKKMTDRTGIKAWEQDGVVRWKHLHRGRVGYHSPEDMHTNPAARHPKGQLIV